MVKEKPEPGTPEYEAWGLEAGRKLKEQCVTKIKTAIQERGLSQKRITEDTGISRSALSRFMAEEDSPITFERLIMLLTYLNFSWTITAEDGSKSDEPITMSDVPKRKKKKR